MKKFTKILTIVLLVSMIVMSATSVFATGTTAKGVIDQIEDKASTTTVDTTSIAGTVGTIVAYLRNAAIIIGVIVIIILGIKYMTGSIEEKAGYQKSFVPLIVGIVVVIAATSIASFLFSAIGA